MHPELKWFFLLILILFVAWVATNGPARIPENQDRPFLEQPAPVESGQTYTLEQLKDRTRP